MKVEYRHASNLWKVTDGNRVYYVSTDRRNVESVTHGPLSRHGRTAQRVLAALPPVPDELAARRRRRGR
ncbi:hypothetical protein SEA_BOBBOB_78 [Gordonia phage BobBob]|nr:hypothetical protein SEA_BOBBOB_78 [Gordonia phage BobBob]